MLSQLMHYVYILLCSDKRTYIGLTKDLKDRVNRHQSVWVPVTKYRIPIELTTYFAFKSETTARNFEKYLKSGSGRAFIKKHNFF